MPPKETKSSQNRAASSKHKQWYRNARFERRVPFFFMGLSKQRYKSSLLNQKGTLCACQPFVCQSDFWNAVFSLIKLKCGMMLRKAEKRRKNYRTDQNINQELLKNVREVFHQIFRIMPFRIMHTSAVLQLSFSV